MVLPSSGQISLDDIHVEAGGTSLSEASINDADIRGLLNPTPASGSEMEFSDWYGASNTSFVGVYTRAIIGKDALLDIDATTPINLTGAGVQVGDLVVIAMTSDNTVDHNPGFTGMTLTSEASATTMSNPGQICVYGFWQSGNFNPYVQYVSSAKGRPLAIVAAIFRNTNTSLLNSARSSGIVGMPDPPSISSVAGTKIIVATGHLDDDAITMTAGSGYTLAGAISATDGSIRASTGVQYKITSTSTTENPPVFGGGGNDNHVAFSLRF